MATYIYGTTTNHWRAYGAYSTTEANDSVTVTVSEAGMQSQSWGFQLSSGVSTSVSLTNQSSTLSGSGSFYSSTGATSATSYTSGSWKVSKTTSAQTLTLTVTTTNASGYMNGTSSATASITIPALATYTVSYNANGGSGAPDSQTKTYGVTLTLSSTKPTRTGYTFQGWATSSGGSVAYSAGGSYTTNAAVTLYAVWKADTYTVSYNANGGSGAPSSQTKTYGVTLTLSTTKPTRTGYSFQGWATSASGSVAYAAGGSYTNNAAVTLYAVWKADTYTVSYNANGGSGAPSSQTKTYGVTLTLSTTKPTRTGYSFQGWATSASGSVAYAAGGSYTTNAAVTLYAVWKADTYTVSYNANGGSGAPDSQTKTYGVTLTLSSTKPTRTGYSFQGWATSASGSVAYSAGGSYTNNSAVTLYAVWKADTYTVSFNANGGSGAPSDQTKTYGVTLTLSSTKPTRTGYVFQGWGTSASTTTVSYSAGGSYTANSAATLYAVWKAETYTVSFNANNGSGAPSAQTKTYGVDLTLSSTKPTRTGYSFKGWATSASGTVVYEAGGTYKNNSAVTLYAVWEANTYTVKYDANTGSGAPDSQTKTYGVTLILSSVVPTKQNYKFLGWATSSTSTDVAYKAGAEYTNNSGTTLYAVWELVYVAPSIASFTAERCDKNGSADDSGTYVSATCAWSVDTSVKSDNTASSITFSYKKYQDSDWTVGKTVEGGQSSGTTTVVFGDGNIEEGSTYNVRVVVADADSSSSDTTLVPSSSAVIDVGNSGKSIAFGKVASADVEGVECAMDVTFDSNTKRPVNLVNTKGNDAFYTATNTDTGTVVGFGVGSGGVNHGVWSDTLDKWLVYGDDTSVHLNGNAASADVANYYDAHTETASGTDANSVHEGMAKDSGLYLTGSYNDSATPETYGNIINMAGKGSGQLFCGWSGTDSTTGNLHYRSHRDTSTGGWGAWNQVYTSGNIIPVSNGGTGASSAAEARSNLGLTSTDNIGTHYYISDQTNGTTGKYRKIASRTLGGWTTSRLVFAYMSRHSGSGILCASVSSSNSSGTAITGAQVTTLSGDHDLSNHFFMTYSSSTKEAALWWYGSDYNDTSFFMLQSRYWNISIGDETTTAPSGDTVVTSAYPRTVVATGTSGIWRYIKYSDGYAECFGTTTFSVSSWSATSSGVYYYNTPAQTLPFTFSTFLVCLSSAQDVNTTNYQEWTGVNNWTSYSTFPVVSLWRANSCSVTLTIRVFYYLYGRY